MNPSLVIATDGSANPNPGPCGWAWVAEDGTYGAGSSVRGTNNTAELTAIIEAVLAHPHTDLVIEYDSQYAWNCLTVWGPSWRRQGRTDKKNMDLVFAGIDALDAHRASARLEGRWVRGHSTTNEHPLNTTVDRVCAVMSARRADTREHGALDILHDADAPLVLRPSR